MPDNPNIATAESLGRIEATLAALKETTERVEKGLIPNGQARTRDLERQTERQWYALGFVFLTQVILTGERFLPTFGVS